MIVGPRPSGISDFGSLLGGFPVLLTFACLGTYLVLSRVLSQANALAAALALFAIVQLITQSGP